MKSKKAIIYTIVILGDRDLREGIGDCMIASCTNKRVLFELTGIPFDRLVYIFTKLKRNHLHERGVLVFKSDQLYQGRQIGGLRNPNFVGYNRNR